VTHDCATGLCPECRREASNVVPFPSEHPAQRLTRGWRRAWAGQHAIALWWVRNHLAGEKIAG
jgi:hypothetical protein